MTLNPQQFNEDEEILAVLGGQRRHVSRMTQDELFEHILKDHNEPAPGRPVMTRDYYKKILGPKPESIRRSIEEGHEKQHRQLRTSRQPAIKPHKHGPR